MPIENPAFAERGVVPGEPRGWAVRSWVQAQRVAGFGPAPFEGVENFERWSELMLRLGVLEQAFFDARPEGYEDFAEGWDVDSYVVDFSDVPAALVSFAGEPAEAFAQGWGVEAFAWSLSDTNVLAAVFVSEEVERFERGHRNDAYRWAFRVGDLAPAPLGPSQAEAFETTWPARDARGG